MTKKIIFLDDSMQRTHAFQSRVPPALTCETAASCINLIRAYGVDSVGIHFLFLDHDLGGETWVDSNREDCGMEVVRWLCAHTAPVPQIDNIVVHSHNVSAAQEMFSKLEDAGYKVSLIPFISLMKTLNFEDVDPNAIDA